MKLGKKTQVAGLFYMMLSKIKINLKQIVSPKTALKTVSF